MINFPCAKINLGLNVVGRRSDGYHNLQTVFFPIPLNDTLEINIMDERFPSDVNCDLKISGNAVCCNETDNLVVKAYNIIAQDYTLPRIHAHLYKHIPSEAGLGGGSSDATFMIRLINDICKLNLTTEAMMNYATQIGADCPFFVKAKPAYAEGIGEKLSDVYIADANLKGYHIIIVKPNISVSTKEAFSLITPQKPALCCRDVVALPVEKWRYMLSNDFEKSVFDIHPHLSKLKDVLYDMGAIYAQMSGSGSSLFGIFKTKPLVPSYSFPNCIYYELSI